MLILKLPNIVVADELCQNTALLLQVLGSEKKQQKVRSVTEKKKEKRRVSSLGYMPSHSFMGTQ